MRVLVAIPIHNEEASVERVLSAVRRYGHDILVIDDGSTDRTPELLERIPDITTITHPENRGYGQSLIDAFGHADRNGYDWVITLDCDEQHEPALIPAFVEAASAGDADLVSGSRYLGECGHDDPAPEDRRAINFTINRLLRQILDIRVTDSFCGFKAHRVAAMRKLNLNEPGYAFPMQFWVQFARADLRLRELRVPRIYRDQSRTFGGTLDDPAARLTHYLNVFVRELNRDANVTEATISCAACAHLRR